MRKQARTYLVEINCENSTQAANKNPVVIAMFRPRNSRRDSMGGIGLKYSSEVNVPADIVWNLLLDVESHPKLYRTCLAIENIRVRPQKSLSPVEAGAKYCGTYVNIMDDKRKKKPVKYVASVTVLEDNADHTKCRRISSATTLFYSTGTSTYTVQETGGRSCRILLTYGLVPDGWRGSLYLWLFGETLARVGSKAMQEDIDDIKNAAESGTFYGGEPIPTSSISGTHVVTK